MSSPLLFLAFLASATQMISVSASGRQGFSEYAQMQPGPAGLQRRSVTPTVNATVGSFVEIFPNTRDCTDGGATIPIAISSPVFGFCYTMSALSTAGQDSTAGGFTTDAAFDCDDGLVSAAYFWKTDATCNFTLSGLDPNVLAAGNDGCNLRGEATDSSTDDTAWVAFKFGCVVGGTGL